MHAGIDEHDFMHPDEIERIANNRAGSKVKVVTVDELLRASHIHAAEPNVNANIVEALNLERIVDDGGDTGGNEFNLKNHYGYVVRRAKALEDKQNAEYNVMMGEFRDLRVASGSLERKRKKFGDELYNALTSPLPNYTDNISIDITDIELSPIAYRRKNTST